MSERAPQPFLTGVEETPAQQMERMKRENLMANRFTLQAALANGEKTMEDIAREYGVPEDEVAEAMRNGADEYRPSAEEVEAELEEEQRVEAAWVKLRRQWKKEVKKVKKGEQSAADVAKKYGLPEREVYDAMYDDVYRTQTL